MATTSRQTAIFGVEDWKQIYQAYQEANFQSYDFETLRKTFVDYLRLYYPETFNDYIESSEFIALLDVMAFMGQSLAFRGDLNARENYIDTAERRDSVIKLANLVGYTPKRNTEANGFLKVFSVQTTENIIDYNGVNLSNITVNWADPTNLDWQEQFNAIVNAAFVDTQRVGRPGARTTILDIDTSEYTINLVPGYLPVIPFTATIDGVNMPFEVVNSTAAGESFIYEPAPLPNGRFNILLRNDQLGFASADTGFFFYFKQGVLQNQDFNLPERVSNRQVNINIEGINNTDVWLYQLDNLGNISYKWTPVASVYAAATENANPNLKNIYSVASRTNDQITLNFGDGVFSTIPVGTFRTYVRASNGLQYIINPEEMQNVQIPISYVSRTGQIQTITFTCGITVPVTNALPRETLQQIKLKAPARYYTQNRMVNGEDYNNFPFTNYNSIIKSQALNRASIGTGYLNLIDPTGKYSSTNTFADDGALYQNNSLPSFQFTWNTQSEVLDTIINLINPTLLEDGARQFYYANYPRPSLSIYNESWHQSTRLANETTGYFQNSFNNPVPVGPGYASNNNRYIQVGSLIKFVAPTGYYFDATNQLQVGTPSRAGEKLTIWASPSAVYLDGTAQGNGDLPDGTGPVVLNTFVPTGAICNQVIPIFIKDFSTTLQQSIAEQIILGRNFGLGYNNLTSTWYLITSTNLAVDANFSLQYAQNTSGMNLDASWFIQVTNNGGYYTAVTRNLDYYFGSVLETRFFFYANEKIYDSRTGTVIFDFINVLKTNSLPDSSLPLPQDQLWKIIGQPVLSDGLVNDFQVLVGFQDSNLDGIPTNPDIFDEIVAPNVNANTKYVFLQQTVDFNNLQRYLLVSPGTVVNNYATAGDIEAVMTQYVPGQYFYAYADIQNGVVTPTFYQLLITGAGVRYLKVDTTFIAQVGRQSLYFQYRHNSPLTSLIDPGSTNIIDLYVVTAEYYTAYTNWIRDVTNTVSKPTPPTINELTNTYAGLNNYKMISDNLIVNSAEFLPLFGNKAPENLRAIIKVIPTPATTASVSEIKNLVVTYMNLYFDIANWNFGDTFYFSELAAYLHSQAGDIVGSVVLVPLNPLKSFGDLYEIRSAPNQIFVNGATVNDIEVITALTSTNLQTAPGSGVI